MQRALEVGLLPDGGIDAATAFMALYLDAARAMLADPSTSALVILLPPAAHDHKDWRLALARDLAREAAGRQVPARVNIVSARPGEAREATLRYLADAPGVTGQYLVCDE